MGLSGFLILAYGLMKDTVTDLKDTWLGVKIMIGGAQIDEQIRQYIDDYVCGAAAAVSLSKEQAKRKSNHVHKTR